MSPDKCSVLFFNGHLYFGLFKDVDHGIFTRLTGLNSSNMITITNYTHTKSENLVSIRVDSALVFNP